jgi:2-oxoglutarate ferredoxin oxidoreductase subunit beta
MSLSTKKTIKSVEHLHPNDDFLRKMHNFCPGCGNGIILHTLIRSLKYYIEYSKNDGYWDKEKQIKVNRANPLKDFVFVSGIGCSGWIVSPHLDADTIHTTHGRPIPVATGVKVANPNLNVIVVSGDGDLASIGGNHLIHAARRNVEILCILVNNFIFGMTGGQCGPTTLHDAKTTTTPYGNFEYPLNVAQLVAAAGAIYSARWTTHHVVKLENSFKKAFDKSQEGFAFIEILSPCPTQFEKRYLTSDDPKILLDFLKERSILIKDVEKYSKEQLREKFILGEFSDQQLPGLVKNLQAMKGKFCKLDSDKG